MGRIGLSVIGLGVRGFLIPDFALALALGIRRDRSITRIFGVELL